MAEFTKEALEKLSGMLNEPAWMLAFRQAAFAVYEATPIPTISEEPWRRTNLRRLPMDKMGPSVNGNGQAESMPDFLKEKLGDAELSGHLRHVDGVVDLFEVTPELKAQGVIFTDMSTAVREHSDLVQKHFMTRVVKPEDGKFAAMHAAFWRGGTFLFVPRGVTVDLPFRSSLWAEKGKTFSHTLIVIEDAGRASLVDEYSSPAGVKAPALHNGVVELIVGNDADLTYASIQDFGTNVWQFTHERARVGQNGQLRWIISAMGTRLTKSFQTVDLDGRGGWAQITGMFFGDGRQHFDLDTQQNHNAPDTTSDLLYKGALKERARSVWQGLIKALPDAQRIDGFQANRNLLLESTARADSIPGLEIEADDVRCTHASTAGQLDPEEIFYLMSRGIEREVAMKMVIEGFFSPVLDRVVLPGIRERITGQILSKVG